MRVIAAVGYALLGGILATTLDWHALCVHGPFLVVSFSTLRINQLPMLVETTFSLSCLRHLDSLHNWSLIAVCLRYVVVSAVLGNVGLLHLEVSPLYR